MYTLEHKHKKSSALKDSVKSLFLSSTSPPRSQHCEKKIVGVFAVCTTHSTVFFFCCPWLGYKLTNISSGIVNSRMREWSLLLPNRLQYGSQGSIGQEVSEV